MCYSKQVSQTSIIKPNKQEWARALKTFEQANFFMSWAYGQAQVGSGFKLERRLIYRDKSKRTLIAIQAVVRNAKRGRYLELHSNPLVADKRLWPPLLKLLKRLAKKHDCSFVRLQPPLLLDEQPQLASLGLRPAKLFLSLPTTSILDLNPSKDQLMGGLRKQTRYSIRQAKKENISIKRETTKTQFDQLLELVLTTAKRRHFVPLSAGQMEQLYKQLKADGQLKLYQAYDRDKQLLSSALIVSWQNEANYFLGASTDLGLRQPGAGLIQWQAILDAKAAGCSRYNFWGIAPENKPKHPLAGITTFKQGFGGQRTVFQPAHDLVLKPLPYLRTYLIELLHRLKRQLR